MSRSKRIGRRMTQTMLDVDAQVRTLDIESDPRGAVISACGAYRYRLWRVWDAGLPRVVYVMLNPSTADAVADDPTIRACTAIARRIGAGRLDVVNLYAFRASKPSALVAAAKRGLDVVGPGNDEAIGTAVQDVQMVICAWGAHTMAMREAPGIVPIVRRDLYVLRMLREAGDVHVLGAGPTHPLARGKHRLPPDVVPILWSL